MVIRSNIILPKPFIFHKLDVYGWANTIKAAKKLVETVDQIAKIFWATKGVDYNDPVSDIRYGS